MNAIEQASRRLSEHVTDCPTCDVSVLTVDHHGSEWVEISYNPKTKPRMCPVAMDICREIFE
jgi:hypothetical protein